MEIEVLAARDGDRYGEDCICSPSAEDDEAVDLGLHQFERRGGSQRGGHDRNRQRCSTCGTATRGEYDEQGVLRAIKESRGLWPTAERRELLTFGKTARSAQFGPTQSHVSLPCEVDDPSTRIQQRDQNAGTRVDPLSLDSPVPQVPEIVHRVFAIARAGKAGGKDLRSGRRREGSEVDMPRGFDPGVRSYFDNGSCCGARRSDVPAAEFAVFTSGGDGATVVAPLRTPRRGRARKSVGRVGRLGRDIKDRDGILGGGEEERRREWVERHRFDSLAATRGERDAQNRRGRMRAGCGCAKVERVGSWQSKDVDLAILASDRDQVIEPVRLKGGDGANPGLQGRGFGPLLALMIIRQDDERTCMRPRGVNRKGSVGSWVGCLALPYLKRNRVRASSLKSS